MAPRMIFGLSWLCLVGVSTSAGAIDLTQSGAIAQLERFSETTQTLQANFEQVTRDSDGYIIDRSEGVFYFKAPNRFRWTYIQPFEEVIVGDGERLWHHDPNLEQVTVRAQPDASESPVLALTDFNVLQARYSLAAAEDSPRIDLTPKASATDANAAWVVLNKGQPRVVGWQDGFSQTTRIEFSGLEYNAELDDALFVFQPPAGVDVLEGL